MRDCGGIPRWYSSTICILDRDKDHLRVMLRQASAWATLTRVNLKIICA
jgi:hypothetical protein